MASSPRRRNSISDSTTCHPRSCSKPARAHPARKSRCGCSDRRRTETPAAMPRSDEAAAFFHAVYSAVQEIPSGKVTSYGHIAYLVGTRKITPPFISISKPRASCLRVASPASPPGRRLPQAPPRGLRGEVQPRQRPVAEGNQLQGHHITTVSVSAGFSITTPCPVL